MKKEKRKKGRKEERERKKERKEGRKEGGRGKREGGALELITAPPHQVPGVMPSSVLLHCPGPQFPHLLKKVRGEGLPPAPVAPTGTRRR